MMKTFHIILSVWMMLLVAACNMNDLEPTLTNDKAVEVSLKNLEDLQGIANGMHDRMTVTTWYGRNMQIYGEVRADNCFANGTSGRFIPEAQMTVSPDN